jgi:O-antigen/teichoic acid export membrane protein
MFTLGVPDALTYFVARHQLPDERAMPVAVLGSLVCSVIACASFWFGAPYLFRENEQYLWAFRILLSTLPLTLFFSAVRGIVQGRQKYDLINRERVSAAVLRLLGLVFVLAIGFLTPLSAVWISVISPLVGSIFLFTGLRGKWFTWRLDEDLGAMARYAAAAALGTFGGLIVIRLDQVLMVSLTSRSELAFYAVAASLAELPLVVVSAVRDLAFSLSAERNDPALMAELSRFTLLTISAFCIAGGVAAPLLLPLLFGRAFTPSVAMVEILLIGSAGRAVSAVMGAGLMTTGKTWLRSGVQIGSAAFTVILIFMCVPRWGGIGAAWVTALTYGVMAAGSTFSFARATGLQLRQCLVPSKQDFEKLVRTIAGLKF